MSTMQREVNGKWEDIEYVVNAGQVAEAAQAIVDLYEYLTEQIPQVKSVLRSCVGKADAGVERTHCALCEAMLGDLLATVDYFIHAERDTIERAYSEALTDEEVEALKNEDLSEDEREELAGAIAVREVNIEESHKDFINGLRGALKAIEDRNAD